jgi:hypothetical protein
LIQFATSGQRAWRAPSASATPGRRSGVAQEAREWRLAVASVSRHGREPGARVNHPTKIIAPFQYLGESTPPTKPRFESSESTRSGLVTRASLRSPGCFPSSADLHITVMARCTGHRRDSVKLVSTSRHGAISTALPMRATVTSQSLYRARCLPPQIGRAGCPLPRRFLSSAEIPTTGAPCTH